MKIYAIRHGQTDSNLNRIVQSWTNNPLNQNGITQAIKMGQFLQHQGYHFDHIYSSPLDRAIKTAELIQEYLYIKKPIMIHEAFIERNFGPFEGGSIDIAAKAIAQPNFRMNGFEHDEALLQRVDKGLKDLYLKHPNDHILLSCHSHVVKSLLILSDPKQYDYRVLLNNASMCIFDYDGQTLNTIDYNIEAIEK